MIKRIAINKLRPGMRTARLDDEAWLHEPELYVGEPVVLTREDILRLSTEGYREVCVVEDGIREVLVEARGTYLEALKVASRIVMDAAQGNDVDIPAARRSVAAVLRQVDEDADALACVVRFTPVETYLCSHMINVTITSLLFGRTLGLGEQELTALGLAAFLHDIGMTRLPLDVLCGKELSSTDEEELRRHPLFSSGMLRTVGGLSRIIRKAVQQHHEKHDGSGYPAGLSGQEIGAWGRILHLADMYDALTRDSCRGQSRTPHQALSYMYAMGGTAFDRDDVERFVKCMGVYPPGSMVTLSTGEGAVVLRNDPDTPTKPLVGVVLDEKGALVRSRLENLALEEHEPPGILADMQPGLRFSDIASQFFGVGISKS